MPLGEADVVVADGFSGNILLKGIEGTALFMSSMIKDMFKKNIFTKLSALICGDGIRTIKNKLDYRETGGTQLLGITKPVIKAHGSSDARAMRSSVRQAIEAAQANIAEDIQANIEKMTLPKELETC